MRLSRNFSLSEFTKSQTAIRKGISNKPSVNDIARLRFLCLEVLQPLRDEFNDILVDCYVVINSGYRSPKLNKAIGGSSKSQHCLGEAADIEIPGMDNMEVAKWIRSSLNFDQLILEYYKSRDPRSGWVHVSYRKGKNRRQILRAVKRGRKTVYLKGL